MPPFLNQYYATQNGCNTILLRGATVPVFSTTLASEKVSITVSAPHQPADFIPALIRYFQWRTHCEAEMTAAYNTLMQSYKASTANAHCYQTSEAYRVRINVGLGGALYADIAAGDSFSPDHLLDIETAGHTIDNMGYDG